MLSRFALAVLLMPFAVGINAATVVYPRNSTSVDYAFEPFTLDSLDVVTCRYQQVYGASRFAEVLPDGLTITQVSFAVDTVVPRGFTTLYPDIQIDLSVTARHPDQLSTNFLENLGTNTVTVYPRGRLEISGFPETGVAVRLSVPFFYNPTEGNLLMDIRKFARIVTDAPPYGFAGVFDAFDVEGDAVSRVFSYNVNSPSGTADTVGLTTIFRVIPPPTPRLRFFGSFASHETNLVVSWFRVPGNYTLQESPVLGSGASWQPYGGIVYSYEEYFEVRVRVSPNDTARFFRLVSQASTNTVELQSDNGPLGIPFVEP